MRLALGVAVAVAPGLAAASPTDELRDARDAFVRKDCKDARLRLKDLLFPEQLSDRDDLFYAHAMLGACEVTDQPEDAKEQFAEALQVEPDGSLDKQFFSTDAIQTFDDVKAKLAIEREERMVQERVAERLQNAQSFRETNPYLVYVPFGIGQFNNGDFAKGGAFLAGEFLTAGTSIGIWLYLAETYGLHSSSVPFAEAQTVHNLQGVEIATGALFFAGAIGGIVEARLHYKQRVLVPNSEQLLKDLHPDPLPPKPAKTSLHWGPIVVPNGGGIGLSLETP